MRRRTAVIAVALIGVVAALGSAPGPAAALAGAPAGFLARYVTSSGQVVRHDQGGDTVSEGQGYALLVAEAVGDQPEFARVWSWTREHLERPDGLLAWHWDHGHILDATPASDADLDTAWALSLAANRFRQSVYRSSAQRIASAILAQETVEVRGVLVLVAGPWARTPPYTINPSYASPNAFLTLARATGDTRWTALATASLHLLRSLVTASHLPPDWAIVDPSGAVMASSAPGASTPPEYGYDAARVSIWSAASCDPAWRDVAASSQPLLASPTALPVGSPLTLTGTALERTPNPALTVAAAASAGAAGNRHDEALLWTRAARLDALHPTYYGSAWVALGRLLLFAPTGRWCQ